VLYNTEADITGEVQLRFGSQVISGARNPKTGALYGFNDGENKSTGALGEPLTVSLPSSTAVTFDVTWREAPSYSMESE